jgi:hypothetical protein
MGMGDEFFTTFLGNQNTPSVPTVVNEEIKTENEIPVSNWNSWGESNITSQIVSQLHFLRILS